MQFFWNESLQSQMFIERGLYFGIVQMRRQIIVSGTCDLKSPRISLRPTTLDCGIVSRTFLGVSPDLSDMLSRDSSSSPLSMGGLGLRNAVKTSVPSFWASWADSLQMVHERHPVIAERIVEALERGATLPHCVLWWTQRGPWTEWRVSNSPVGGLSAEVHALQTVMPWRWSLAQCGEVGNMRQFLVLNDATVERQSCLFWTLLGKLS